MEQVDEAFEAWRTRDLSQEDIAIVFLDGFNLKIRLAKRVEKIPVCCEPSECGATEDGACWPWKRV